MSTRIIDEAAKVLADPIAYDDEARLHATLTHLAPTLRCPGSKRPVTGRSGRSPGMPTSWRSSAPTRFSPTRRTPGADDLRKR